MSKILLIGGPGNISGSTIESLLAKGDDIAILKRSEFRGDAGMLRIYRGDRNRPEDLAHAIDDFKPDVVADFVCFNETQAEMMADAAEGKVEQFVFVSTVDVYGYPLARLPMREHDRFGTPTSPYGVNKKRCEEVLLARHESGRLPLTIVRPTYSFGHKRGLLSFFAGNGMKFQAARIRAGLPVLVPGDGTTLWHASSAYNTGQMIAEIISRRELTVGRRYNCGHEDWISFDDYIRMVADALGKEVEIVHIPTDFMLSLPDDCVHNSYLATLTRYNMCFSVEAFRRDFPDFVWKRTLREEIGMYVDWFDRNQLFPEPGEPICEDRIIEKWRRMMGALHSE